MKRTSLRHTALVLASVVSLALPLAAQQAQPWKSIPIPPLAPFHPAQPKRIELKNGMVIFLLEDHELPFVNGFFEIRGGERDVPAAKAGLVGLYGEAWRTSGTAKHDGDALDDLLEAKAAKVETGGDVDSTSVAWSCLKGDLDLVFGVAVDLLQHPVFNEGKLKLAQQQAATGIVRRNDDADSIAQREAVRLAYGKDNPYARQPELATVLSVTVDDLKQFHDKTVAPNNIIVGITGDFDSAAMEAKLRAAFEGLPRGTAITAPRVDFAGPKPGVYLIDKKDVNQSNVWITGLGTKRDNPDYYALSLMNQIFSGGAAGTGFGSRLVQDVRTKQGLAYEVGGSYSASYDHPGLFYVIAATRSANTEKTAAAMLKDIGELKTLPFTEAELTNAREQLLNSFIFHYDTIEKVLGERVKLEFYGYPADLLEQYRAGIEKVTTADLDRVAKKYIDPSKLAVLVVGHAEEFQTPLTGLGLGEPQPVDITIPMPPGMGGGPQGGKDQ